jgi:hypothetical protein
VKLTDKNACRVISATGTTLATKIVLLAALLSILTELGCSVRKHSREMSFEVSFPASVHEQAITGRLFVVITRSSKYEPRLQIGDAPVFGTGVEQLAPGASVRIDTDNLGYPVRTLRDLPDGDYYVQALLNVYTEFHRADGHVLWLHMDQWEGQDLARSPGNLISEVKHVHLDPSSGYHESLLLSKVIPPIEVPADTPWVKRVKFQSKLLSQFWGRPIFIGATVLLPRGYSEHPDTFYPAIYLQGHFSLDAPFGFETDEDKNEKSWALDRREHAAKHLNFIEPPPYARASGSLLNVETGYEFYQAWNLDDFPRVIAVTFQHPTPYYDDSYAVNSANHGPAGDAIMNELIPYVEKNFRIIRKPYARVLTGGSTGGWESLALQVYHPDFFGGTWTFYPDPVDFRRFGDINLYTDDNAYTRAASSEWLAGSGEWLPKPERYAARHIDGQPSFTFRRFDQMLTVLGDRGTSGVDDSTVYSPVATNGYPEPLWDTRTGKINHKVAEYMREHGYDLCDYMEKNWPRIGPQLVGKLHIICGDADSFYSNLALYLLEDFLENTKNPHYAGSFVYGRPMKGHGWQPTTNADLVKEMGKYIARNTPSSDRPEKWHYH